MQKQSKEVSTSSKCIRLLPFFIFYILLSWFVSGNIFFWDTIQLGAKHGVFFYENNFSSMLLPDEFDSGHIPTFGAYLAFAWKLFGKSLVVSHFAMLPFLFGIVWQASDLIKNFVQSKYHIPALILFLADPTLLGQSTLMSPDIPLVFFFLYALNAILKNRRLSLTFAITGLFLVSMRGMMTAFALFIIDIVINIKWDNYKSILLALIRRSVIYLPAIIIFLGFNTYHYLAKGWIGYHENSPWAACFIPVDAKGIFYNTGLLCWRIIDFGRVFLVVAGFIIIIKYYKNIRSDQNLKRLFLIFFSVLICLSVSFILYKNLNGHRYILPVYLCISLIIIYLVFEKLSSEKSRYLVFTILLAGLISGHFWIYPDWIAKGWDASLAHLYYYPLRNEMMDYMQKEGISIQEVGTAFPNLAELRYLELSEDRNKHPEKNLDTDKYILYSNVYNDFKDEEITRLEREFVLIKDIYKGGVKMKLYKKP